MTAVSDLKPGDRVRVVFEGTVDASGDAMYAAPLPRVPFSYFGPCRLEHATSIELLDRPLPPVKIGDFVQVTDGKAHNLPVGSFARVRDVPHATDGSLHRLDGYTVQWGCTDQFLNRSQFELA